MGEDQVFYFWFFQGQQYWVQMGGWCKEEKEITDLFLSLFDRELGLGPEQGFW